MGNDKSTSSIEDEEMKGLETIEKVVKYKFGDVAKYIKAYANQSLYYVYANSIWKFEYYNECQTRNQPYDSRKYDMRHHVYHLNSNLFYGSTDHDLGHDMAITCFNPSTGEFSKVEDAFLIRTNNFTSTMFYNGIFYRFYAPHRCDAKELSYYTLNIATLEKKMIKIKGLIRCCSDKYQPRIGFQGKLYFFIGKCVYTLDVETNFQEELLGKLNYTHFRGIAFVFQNRLFIANGNAQEYIDVNNPRAPFPENRIVEEFNPVLGTWAVAKDLHIPSGEYIIKDSTMTVATAVYYKDQFDCYQRKYVIQTSNDFKTWITVTTFDCDLAYRHPLLLGIY